MATVTLRLPDEMHERIKKAAEEDVRTGNEEFVWLLKIGLDVRGSLRTTLRKGD